MNEELRARLEYLCSPDQPYLNGFDEQTRDAAYDALHLIESLEDTIDERDAEIAHLRRALVKLASLDFPTSGTCPFDALDDERSCGHDGELCGGDGGIPRCWVEWALRKTEEVDDD